MAMRIFLILSLFTVTQLNCEYFSAAAEVKALTFFNEIPEYPDVRNRIVIHINSEIEKSTSDPRYRASHDSITKLAIQEKIGCILELIRIQTYPDDANNTGEGRNREAIAILASSLSEKLLRDKFASSRADILLPYIFVDDANLRRNIRERFKSVVKSEQVLPYIELVERDTNHALIDYLYEITPLYACLMFLEATEEPESLGKYKKELSELRPKLRKLSYTNKDIELRQEVMVKLYEYQSKDNRWLNAYITNVLERTPQLREKKLVDRLLKNRNKFVTMPLNRIPISKRYYQSELTK